MKPLFLQIPLTDAIKMPPYLKYMKDIVTNKRKIPSEKFPLYLLITLLMVKFRRSLEIQVCQLFLAPLKITMLELLCVIWEMELVSCLFSLYKRLDLEKLISTDISLQMADKFTTIPIGICENVPVQVANNCLILTDFVVLEMPEDDDTSNLHHYFVS
jgi:hypothetical protein